MQTECMTDPPDELQRAIDEFNAGQYFECHETLEDIWRDEIGSIRNLYKGILQIGVAIHHLERSNTRGALRLLMSGVDLLREFEPACLGIDVRHLLDSASRLVPAIEDLAPGQSVSEELIPRIRSSVR